MILPFMQHRHSNEGTTVLSKIIFDCLSKARIRCVVKDIDAMYGIIPRGNMCRIYLDYVIFCTAYLDNTRLTIDFRPISKSLEFLDPKFWHILVRPDSMACQYEVDIDDPKALDELIELFIALRPVLGHHIRKIISK
jgi:hypothetical protein